jgi:hypothetical protein
MSRLDTMSRFAEPDDDKPMAVCCFCDADLFEGDTVKVLDHEIYCSAECVADAVTYTKTLGE